MVTQADVIGFAPAATFDAVVMGLGSIGFDTTNKLLRAGDGQTAGGLKIGGGGGSSGGAVGAASIAELQAVPSSNKAAILAVPGIGGLFAWTPANMSAMVAIDTQRGIYVPPASDTSGASGCWIRQFSGLPNLAWFGAVAGQDSTVACRVGIAVANALNTMATITPSDQPYFVGETLRPTIGFVGIHPRLVTFGATSAAAFADGKAIMECDAIGAFFADFGIVGNGVRQSTRSADQSTMNFNGDGLRFTSNANRVVVRNVRIEKCRRGFDMQNENGHINIFGGFASNNWWNVYIGKNTGDYLFAGVDLDGALYASIGVDKDYVSGTKPGGISAAVFMQCHLGFCPYGIRQEPGSASVGLGDITLIHCRFEKIGNRAISITGANTSGVRITAPGHGWASDSDNYQINGNADHPVRDYACVYNNIAGGAAGATMRVEGAGWMAGTTGFHTRINGAIQHFITDTNGTAGYSFNANAGGDRIMDGSQPAGQVVQNFVNKATINDAGSFAVTSFTRLTRHRTAFNFSITGVVDYSAANTVVAVIKVNGIDLQRVPLAAGSGSFAIDLKGQLADMTLAVTIENASGLTIYSQSNQGRITYAADYGAAIV